MRTGSVRAGMCLTLLSTFAISCSSSDMMTTTGGTGGSPGGATGGSGGGATGVCATLMNYTPTTSTAPSFATDIYPILSNTDVGSPSKRAPGCGQTILCHGSPPATINMAATASLSFVDTAATVKTALLANAVNAPSMKRVDPGHVGNSFLAYKISGTAGLACVSSSCPAGVTVGNTKPCGDPMPNSNGQGGTDAVLTDAERSKILDWIALGAHD